MRGKSTMVRCAGDACVCWGHCHEMCKKNSAARGSK